MQARGSSIASGMTTRALEELGAIVNYATKDVIVCMVRAIYWVIKTIG